MAIPRQTSHFDERRNTSRVFRPAPDALANAERALARWRRDEPAHAQWIADGYPTLSEGEHVARFGVPYERVKRRAASAAA